MKTSLLYWVSSVRKEYMRSFTISMLAAITAISFIPEDAKVIVTGICLIAVLYVLSSHMVQHKQ